MASFLSKYMAKYYYVIIFIFFLAALSDVSAQDLITKNDGEVLSGAIKLEFSGALKFKPEGQRKSIQLDAADIKSYYSSEAKINMISRKASNSQGQVFFPELTDVSSAMEYDFLDGVLQVIPCGEIKLYKYRLLGEAGIHGGRVEYVEIYLEDAEHGLYKVYGNDISEEKQQEVLTMFAQGKRFLSSKVLQPMKIHPKRIDELVLFCSAIVY